MEFLSLYGTATIIQNEVIANELWSAPAKIWFKDANDPNLTIIKVTPEDGYYWDTKNGRLVTLLKIAVAAVTGNSGGDGSIEGQIHV